MEIGEFAHGRRDPRPGRRPRPTRSASDRWSTTAELVRLQLHLRIRGDHVDRRRDAADARRRRRSRGRRDDADALATGVAAARARERHQRAATGRPARPTRKAIDTPDGPATTCSRCGSTRRRRWWRSTGRCPSPTASPGARSSLGIAEGDRRAQAHDARRRSPTSGRWSATSNARAMTTGADAPSWRSSGCGSTRRTISIDSGPVELLAGDPVAAEAELRKDYEALDAMASATTSRRSPGLLAEALYRQGRFDEAAAFRGVLRGGRGRRPTCISQYLWRGIRGSSWPVTVHMTRASSLPLRACERRRPPTTSRAKANALVFLAEAQALQRAGSRTRPSPLAEARASVRGRRATSSRLARIDELVSSRGRDCPSGRS